MRFLSRAALAAVCLLIVFSMSVQAGVVMKVKSLTEAHKLSLPGQPEPRQVPETEAIHTYYFEDGSVRADLGDTLSMTYQTGGAAVAMMRHNPKTWTAMPMKGSLDSLARQLEETRGKQAAEQMKKVMESTFRLTAEVEPTDETKEIKGYECKKYNVTMSMGMVQNKMEWWVTDDIKFDHELLPFASWSQLAAFPGFAEATAELAKINGMTVQGTNKTLMGADTIVTHTQLLEVNETDIPPSQFKVPEEYERQPFELGGGYNR
jgi:hypothetical protein